MKGMLAALLLCAAAAAQAPPTRILVADSSDTGNTEKMARAVREGAASVAGVEVWLRTADAATADEITGADGILLGTPVHWQSVSAQAKRFLDRAADTLLKARKTSGEGRAAGAFCTGGAVASGKDLARLTAVAAFLAMRFVIIGGVDAEGYGTLGAQATTGPGDAGLSAAELEEARRFGERFARLTREIRSATRAGGG
jgi:NAD(P)H dehydrogenase (quinone)